MTESTTIEFSPAQIVGTLAFIGFLSGLIIVTAYDTTLPAITAYKAQMLRQSVLQVLPGTSKVKHLVWRQGKLIEAEAK